MTPESLCDSVIGTLGVPCTIIEHVAPCHIFLASEAIAQIPRLTLAFKFRKTRLPNAASIDIAIIQYVTSRVWPWLALISLFQKTFSTFASVAKLRSIVTAFPILSTLGMTSAKVLSKKYLIKPVHPPCYFL